MAPDSLSDVSMLSCLPQLFSDHEPMRSPSPQISQSDITPELSLTGTSAPPLTQPSLTDYLSNYLLWPNQDKNSTAPLSCPSSPSLDAPRQICHHHPPLLLSKGGGETSKENLSAKSTGQNSVQGTGTKTRHSDGTSETVPIEA